MIKFINTSDEAPYKVFKEKYEDSLNANQKIIEAMDGEILVDSEIGKGSTFIARWKFEMS